MQVKPRSPHINLAQPNAQPTSREVGEKSSAPSVADDQVTLTSVEPDASTPKQVDLIPIALGLKVPFTAVGGVFGSLPVLLDKGLVDDPNWSPQAGTAVPFAPAIDSRVTLNAPAGQRPVALPVKTINRDSLPENKTHHPLLLTEFDQPVDYTQWTEAPTKALNSQSLGGIDTDQQDTHLNFILGVDQEQLAELGNKDLVLVPQDRIDPETMTWKNGEGNLLKPDFVSANLLDEDGSPDLIPQVEYLMVDAKMAETDLPTAGELAKAGRPMHQARVSTEFGGEPVSFDVQVTERFQKSLARTPGASFDAQSGAILIPGADGTEQELNLTLSKSIGEFHDQVPAWLLQANDTFALPKNRVVVDINAKTGQPLIDCPEGYTYKGATSLEAGRTYKVQVPGVDGPREIGLRFTEKAKLAFSASGFTLGKAEAILYGPKGERLPLDGRVQQEPTEEQKLMRGLAGLRPLLTVENAPPWTFETYKTSRSALLASPKYGLEVDAGDNGQPIIKQLDANGNVVEPTDDSQGFEFTIPAKRMNREQRLKDVLGDAARFEGNKELSVPLNKWDLGDKTTVKARSQDVAIQAKKLAGMFLGLGRSESEVDPQRVLDFKARIAIDPTGLSPEEISRKTNEILGPLEIKEEMAELAGQEWEGQPLEELAEGLNRTLRRGTSVEIVVVPKGGSVEPYLDEKERATATNIQTEMAAIVLSPKPELMRKGEEIGKTRVIISEALFETPERKVAAAHEMLHAFENVYATDQDHEIIERSFQKARQENLEYPSLYGALRGEFLPTMGEEFLGLHGADGPAWVKKEHPEMYKLLCSLTGHDPVKDGAMDLR